MRLEKSFVVAQHREHVVVPGDGPEAVLLVEEDRRLVSRALEPGVRIAQLSGVERVVPGEDRAASCHSGRVFRCGLHQIDVYETDGSCVNCLPSVIAATAKSPNA